MSDSDAIRSDQELGAYLRETRESRGLCLDDAARETRISKIYLIAIEDGRFEKLPSVAYVKGFLRLYARFLGLSGDDIVARFDRVTGQPQSSAVSEPSRERPDKSSLPKRRNWLLTAFLLFLVIVAAYVFKDDQDPPPRTQQALLPVVAKPADSKPQLSQPPAQASNVVGAILPPQAAPSASEALSTAGETPLSGVVLRLKFNSDSWLNMTIDDSISQRYALKSGDVIEWKGASSFVVDLGDAGAVEAVFNGRPLAPFGKPGEPAHVVLKK